MTSDRPAIFSFFAGAGFLDLGFETTGFKVVYVNEICSSFMAAYRYSRELLNFPLPEYGYHDGEAANVSQLVEEVQTQRLLELVQDCRKSNNIVGFIGGPPCPDFSIGGKNKGYLGDNGKLTSAYVELICQNLPDFFLFENVKGLYRIKKHRLFFESLKRRLKLAGYILTERLINAIEYGVPQHRERIILIGFYNHFIKDFKLKNNLSISYWQKHIIHTKEKIFAYPWPSSQVFQVDSILPCPQNILQEVTVEFWFRKNKVLNHPNAKHYFQPRSGINKFLIVDEGDDSKKSFKRLHRWRYSPTVCYGNNEVHLHPYKVRRISVAEALAIQSLPANFILPEHMPLTNMFKTISNGVPYLASQALAKTVLDFLGFNTETTVDLLQ